MTTTGVTSQEEDERWTELRVKATSMGLLLLLRNGLSSRVWITPADGFRRSLTAYGMCAFPSIQPYLRNLFRIPSELNTEKDDQPIRESVHTSEMVP